MKEDLTFVVDSLGVARPEKIIEAPSHSLPELFAQGGMGGMILITVLLVCLLLAAWKAPRWVKEIGIGTFVVTLFISLLGLAEACNTIQMIGDVPPAILAGGIKVCLIPVLYGLIVYFISLIIRIIQKPRI